MPTPSPSQTLRLHLHTDVGVHGPQGLLLPLQGRAALLVALAALEPGIARQRAAQLLWPDAASPRQNLRQQLLRFRKALGRSLIDGDEALRLAEGVVLADAPPDARLLPAEQPLDDELLDWLDRQRAAQRAAGRDPLRAALSTAEAEGALDEALALAQRLVTLDGEADEAAQAALMRVHYLRGDAAAGLASFRRLQSALRVAGAEPSQATQQLAAALEHSVPHARAPAPAALPATLQRPPRLVGRDAERAQALQGWQEGRVVLVDGEAGMGKSRFVAELTAGREGVLAGQGRPGDRGAPYATLERLLRPLAPYAPLASEPPRPGAVEQRCAELLAERGIATVVLDDLHFADDATLELLLALAAGRGPVQHWVFAQRPAEVSAATQALHDGLLEQGRLQRVVLAPLDTEATRHLVEGLGVAGLDALGLADALMRHTGGNPLFVLETLKQGLLDGSLSRGTLPLPGSVGALIERRLQRMDARAVALARVAAVAGADFRIELAEEALGLRPVDLADAWGELQQAQVLRDEAFAHDLVADAVLRSVPAAVARRVHAQCAGWLQQHGGEPARVARHWRAGGHPREAALAFTQAAARAHGAARQAEEAALHAEAASAYADAGLDEERFGALVDRVNALVTARADEAAVAEARALAHAATTDAQRVRAARVLTDLLGQRGQLADALAVGREGMALAQRAGLHDEHVRLCSLTAGNLCKTGAPDEAYSLMLPLRAWVDASPDDNLRFVWYGYWAATLGHIGRLREGVAAYDVTAGAAERAGDRAAHSMARLNQCVVLRTMGALDRACAASRDGLALAPDEPGNTNHGLARLMHARNEAETGAFGSAWQTLDELLPVFERMGAPFWVWAARGTLARLWQHLGQHARALQALQAVPAAPAEGLPDWMRAGLLWAELDVADWLGQPTAAPKRQQALALLDGDRNRRPGNRVRGLRFQPAAAVLDEADELAAAARGHEQFGVLAALHVHETRAAVAVADAARAQQAATALQALLGEGYAPEFTYLPEAWLVAAEAWQLAGDGPAAQRALAVGAAWVQGRALPQVPPPFVDSFLQRNPVNRRLLGLARTAA